MAFLFSEIPLQWLYDKEQIQNIVRALNKLRDPSVFLEGLTTNSNTGSDGIIDGGDRLTGNCLIDGGNRIT